MQVHLPSHPGAYPLHGTARHLVALGSQAPRGRFLGLLEQVALPVCSVSLPPDGSIIQPSHSPVPPAASSRHIHGLEMESRAQHAVARGPGSPVLGPSGWRRKNGRETPDNLAPLLEPPEDIGAFGPVGICRMSRYPVMLVKELRKVGSEGIPPCLKDLREETKALEETGILGIKKSRFLVCGEMLESSSVY